MERRGIVYLVGAGPGAADLITLAGVRCLERAEVVIYDYLANPRLLEHAPPDAERVLVGKHGGGQRVEQEVITQLLLARARAGKAVVRLKGGDPFVFGRGGEEAMALAQAGISFEVIPGVSSLSSVPGSAGIPITHRGIASAVTAFAAHDVESLDAAALARAPGTLVGFMGLAGLARLAERLTEHGLPSATPAAVVSSGTTEREQVVVAPLGAIAAVARGLPTPALVVIGEVVALREALAPARRSAA